MLPRSPWFLCCRTACGRVVLLLPQLVRSALRPHPPRTPPPQVPAPPSDGATPRPAAVVPVWLTGGTAAPACPTPSTPGKASGDTGRGAGPHSLGREHFEGRASSRKTHPHASSL